MQGLKLRLGIVFFNYGSNGGLRAEVPDIRQWAVKTAIVAKADPRIEEVLTTDISDTPVTMSRNYAVQWARQNKVDVLVMVDSDQAPDLYVGTDPEAVPFFETAFDFVYERWGKTPTVIASPYCGPPPHPVTGGLSLVYVFRWTNHGSPDTHVDMKLEAYARTEAEMMRGIQPCAALPTGLIMFSIDAFDLVPEPVFYYEFEGATEDVRGPEARKASTEDVTATRDISLAGHMKLGKDVVFCAWSSWAGHWKPICVGRPVSIKADHVAKSLRDAVLKGVHSDDRLINLERPKNLPLPAAGVQVVEGSPHRNVEVQNGHAIPVGAGPLQPEIVAKHLMTTDDLEQLDVQVDTKFVELHALQVKVAHECVKKRGKKMVIVEVGSFTGRSAVAMADGVEPGQDFELHCVDHFQGSGTDFTRTLVRQLAKKYGPDVLYKAFERRMKDAGLYDSVHVHRMSSLEAAKQWDKSKPIDVLFLDAGHTYEELRDDIAAWKPLMAEDGLIIGHDYCKEFPGVEQAVVEAFGDATVIHSLWMVKRGAPLEPDTMFDIALGRTGFEDESVAVPNAQFREFVPSLNGTHLDG